MLVSLGAAYFYCRRLRRFASSPHVRSVRYPCSEFLVFAFLESKFSRIRVMISICLEIIRTRTASHAVSSKNELVWGFGLRQETSNSCGTGRSGTTTLLLAASRCLLFIRCRFDRVPGILNARAAADGSSYPKQLRMTRDLVTEDSHIGKNRLQVLQQQ